MQITHSSHFSDAVPVSETPVATTTPAAVVAAAVPVSAAPAPAPTSTFTPAPSPTFVAPSSTYVAPSPTYVAPSPTYVAPAPAPTTAAPASGNQVFSVDASYYHQGGAHGSCGTISTDDQFVVAIAVGMYDQANCGRQVRVTRPSTGKSIVATAMDKCMGCTATGRIDLSVAAFSTFPLFFLTQNSDLRSSPTDALGSEAEGIFPVTWSWL